MAAASTGDGVGRIQHGVQHPAGLLCRWNDRLMTETKPAKAEVHGHRITWYCRVCDQPIGPYAGYLAVDIYAVNEVERDARNRESAEPRAYTAGEVLEFPHNVRWQALHAGCDPDPDGDEYAIDIGRIDTLARLIHWAGYLGSTKTWIRYTDWNQILLAVGEDA